jgi:tRNA G46 methylase TrmB
MTDPAESPHSSRLNDFFVREFNAIAVVAPRNSALSTPSTLAFSLPSSFASTTPLDLEIGCGVGWHPVRYARENTDRFLIALEHTRAKFDRFQSRIDGNSPLPNLLPIHADAVRWITHCLAPASLDRVFILYPNPEPKAPNKRWLRMPFMHRLLETIKPGGEIILATNEKAYFDEALAFAVQTWRLKVARQESFTTHSERGQTPRTHFEKKYLLRGETCFEARFIHQD